jgi:hypothetical protein
MVNTEDLTGKNNPQMNERQVDLYARIQAYSFEKQDAQLSFSKRLARDNGWSLEYARRAIEEYKKFAFLAVEAGHAVTPSDQVDQVWHLHLTYTRSYWEEFCEQVLQTPLHHEPTRGGQAENHKFDDWYSKTLESYKNFFGQTPPAKFWPAPEDRFGRDLHFVRVNTQQNWVRSKLQLQRGLMANTAILLTLILSSCYVGNSTNNINPLTGILFVIICVAAGFGIIRFLAGIVDFIKHPSRPRIYGDWDRDTSGANGGCGSWGNSGDYTSGGDSSSSDGCSGGDGSGGCGGGGCGGGGCGGG